MKKLTLLTLLAVAVFGFSACETSPINNANTNANGPNTNAANAVNSAPAVKTAAPTAEALIAIEKKAWEDWAARNAGGLETYMASKFVNVGYNGASDRTAAMKSWTEHKCEMKDLAFSDEKVHQLADGVALMTFKATSDIKCDGKSGPNPTNTAVLYVREGDAWKAMYYQEVPAADAKGEYAEPTTPFDKEKELASLSAAPNDIADSEKKLWETWKAGDQKGFRELLADGIVGSGRSGSVVGADAYTKSAFDPSCKIESFSLSPMKSMEISKDLTMIFYRASQKGACGETKLPENVMSVAIYKRENGAPKATYYMENPVR